MAKPASVPTWATDATWSSGPRSGSALKTDPGASADQGFVAGRPFNVDHLNHLLNELCDDWTSYLNDEVDNAQNGTGTNSNTILRDAMGLSGARTLYLVPGVDASDDPVLGTTGPTVPNPAGRDVQFFRHDVGSLGNGSSINICNLVDLSAFVGNMLIEYSVGWMVTSDGGTNSSSQHSRGILATDGTFAGTYTSIDDTRLDAGTAGGVTGIDIDVGWVSAVQTRLVATNTSGGALSLRFAGWFRYLLMNEAGTS